MRRKYRPLRAKDVEVGTTVLILGDFNFLYEGVIEKVYDPHGTTWGFVIDDVAYGLKDSYIEVDKCDTINYGL